MIYCHNSSLAKPSVANHMRGMKLGSRWRMYERKPAVRVTLFVLGIFLMIISPIIGALPGPGFIIVFPLGLGLTLKYSRWAKRRYVHFKRRWPKHGHWADWGLRRASAKRRAALKRPETLKRPER
jgi:Putative transmembrane protein (PGPGW)